MTTPLEEVAAAALAHDSSRRRICVFAASSDDVSQSYRTLAYNLGMAITEADCDVVYGGGSSGLMGEVARGAKDNNGRVIGIIPRWLHHRERQFSAADALIKVETMAERKHMMDTMASAFAVLPGGIGTLDELTDVLTTRHLAQHHRPVVLIDPDNFWEPFVALLERMRDANVLASSTIDLVDRRPTVEAAMTALLG